MEFDRTEFDNLTNFMTKLNARMQERNDSLDDQYKNPNNFKRFVIDTHELKAYDEWSSAHKETCRFYVDCPPNQNPGGAIGGLTTFSFTPTGVGVAVHVKCACGEEIDITEYEDW